VKRHGSSGLRSVGQGLTRPVGSRKPAYVTDVSSWRKEQDGDCRCDRQASVLRSAFDGIGETVGEPDGSNQQVLASLRSAIATVARRSRRCPGWAAIAALVLLCGIVGAGVSAVVIAHRDASDSRQQFRSESAQITSTIRLAIEHERDLIDSASGFVIGDPAASDAQFAAWAQSVHALARYPELRGIGHSVIVPAARLSAFAARANRASARSPGATGTFRVVPSGRRAFYCLSVWSLARTTVDAFPAGYDFCARGPVGSASLSSRDSGQGAYLPIRARKLTLLSILTPVYRDGVVPTTVAARHHGFLGWVGMSVMPRIVLARALQGHPNSAVTFHYHSSSSNAVFRAGQVPSGAQSTTTALHNGWTVTTFGTRTDSAVFDNINALTLLIGGIAVSVLLAALILVLATGRSRAFRLVVQRTGELRYQALHDSLTGLPNRALTLDRVERLLARNRRAGTEGAALYVDLDEFKNINDTLGHEAGDRLLAVVAARLTSALPDADTIGRMGADEFVVLIDGGELNVAPSLLAERLLDVMRQPFELDETRTPLSLSASIGIAIAVGDRATPDRLLRDADVALYQAKASGKNRYKTLEPAMQPAISRRVGLVFDLRSALTDEQFRLEYQPIYDLNELTVVGVEALLRWEHPVFGRIGPDEFIPLLERSGQIAEVGRWVLTQACNQMATWHARGDTLDISVNVSGGQLDSDAIVAHISDALASSGLDPTCLIIEVTETALMNNPDATARRLRAIKDLGVRIAVDDFGTGYSSLAYLQQFPVDCLKIDRIFIVSPASEALIRTFVQLGKDLGLTTLAEGVEIPSQLNQLRAGHVDQIQGFLLCKPLDAQALENQILAPTRPQARSSRQA
jgi:diguanylate cyclase (GGDEF)-like protein